MLRFLFVFCAFWLLSFAASAASFDCATTHHPIEQIICETEEFLQFHEEIEQLLHEKQSFVIKGDSSLIDKQKSWWKMMLGGCSTAENQSECVGQYYRDRLGFLKNYLRPSISSKAHETEKLIRLNDILLDYDFELTLEKAPDCHLDKCAPFRQLAIFPKGGNQPLQLIDVPLFGYFNDTPHMVEEDLCSEYLEMSCLDRLLQISKDSAHAASVFEIGDYNFDGFVDFAIHTGNITRRGNKSYWFFLYNPDDEQFYYAPAFSELLRVPLFTINKESEELIVEDYVIDRHEATTYKIEHNMPFPARRTITYLTVAQGFSFEHHEIWQNDAWQLIKKVMIMPKTNVEE